MAIDTRSRAKLVARGPSKVMAQSSSGSAAPQASWASPSNPKKRKAMDGAGAPAVQEQLNGDPFPPSSDSGSDASSLRHQLAPELLEFVSEDQLETKSVPEKTVCYFRGPGGQFSFVAQGPRNSRKYVIQRHDNNEDLPSTKPDVIVGKVPRHIIRVLGAAVYQAKASKLTVEDLLNEKNWASYQGPTTKVLVLGADSLEPAATGEAHKLYLLSRAQFRSKMANGKLPVTVPEDVKVGKKVVISEGQTVAAANLHIAELIADGLNRFRLWEIGQRPGRESRTPTPTVMRSVET